MPHHAYRFTLRSGHEGDFRKTWMGLTEDALAEAGFRAGHVFFNMNVVFLYVETDDEDADPLQALAQSPKTRKFHEALVKNAVYDTRRPQTHRLRLVRAPREALPALVPGEGAS